MTAKEYAEAREAMLAEAEALIGDGKIDEANAKMDEVKALDKRHEAEATARANMNALAGAKPHTSLENSARRDATGAPIAAMMGGAEEDMHDSAEYKRQFMAYVSSGVRGDLINADANTKTSDVGAAIPTTTMQKIVDKMEATGMILPLVTHTSYKGGLAVPTSSVKPTATWVAEGAGSDKQKKGTSSIVFSYYKLRCAVSVSLEVDTVTYPMFEAAFVNNIVEAMVKTKEQAIISGDGSGKPKGILAETPATGQAIEITEGSSITYEKLCEAEAALPMAYEAEAVWFMTKKTFMLIVGQVDSNGQPIARVDHGIDGKPSRTLLGRQVICNPYMSDFATTVTADTIVAFLFNPKDYVLNTNYNITVKRYEDNDTDDIVTKAVELVDGKVVDKNSLVTVTVKNA